MAITSKEPTPAGSHTARLPLSPSDSGNAAPRVPKCREVSSRYVSTSRRCASPAISRKTPVQEASSAVKRAQSVERRQMAATRMNALDLRFAGKASGAQSSHRGVLTCTRSLAVAFQGQSFSLQVSKAKPAPVTVRRSTPERRKPGPPAAGQGNCTSAYEDCTDQRGKFAVPRSLNDWSVSSPDSQRNPIVQSAAQSESIAFPDAEIPTSSSSPKGILNSRRHPSPVYRTAVHSASPSKITTPVRGGASPSRVRSAVAEILSSAIASNAPSIWSCAADLRRGRIAESRIVDAHGLRLLYNRLLQWRFVNARAQSSLNAQEADAVRSLYGTWIIISKLRKSVTAKRMELQLQRHNQKLISILQGQMSSLEAWECMDQDYSSSLSGATEALQASTLRLPVVGGARVDIQKLRDAVCSAADVMQGMASSMCFLLSKVEVLNSTVVELRGVAAKECSLLNQSRHRLSAVAALQVKDYSLTAYEIQLTDTTTKSNSLSGGE